MASVVSPAPTDGAPLLAPQKLSNCFGAIHGKGLNYEAKLFIFDEPTAAVDVGARAEISWMLGSLLIQGAELVMASSCPSKVHDLAGALHLFRAGRLAATHGRKDASHETILTEAIGVLGRRGVQRK